MRQTSIDTYRKIESEGLLSRRRFQVYDCIYNHGPMTANECFKMLGLPTNNSGRFTELEILGVIQEVDKRPCKITCNTSTVWDVTGNVPEGKIESRDLKKEAYTLLTEVANQNLLPMMEREKLLNVAKIIKRL